MDAEKILSLPPRVLTQDQREEYFQHGYTCIKNFVPQGILDELIAITNEFISKSRGETTSGDVFDIAPGHTPESPQLRRLKRPDDLHGAYWRYASGLLADVAQDLVGPDVVFYHSKLNFKWAGDGDTVKWHQDAQFVPHTNYNVVYIGTYLTDTGMNDGPLAILKDSH